MSLQAYQESFRRIIVNMANGRASPHKICMLLAVLDLARSGGLTRNQILFEPRLLERYNFYFSAVRSAKDHSNPYFPFFHLAGELRGRRPSFWHLVAKPGRELVLASMTTATSYRAISENIEFARLDDELFVLLQDEANIDELSETLSTTWFNRGLYELKAVAAQGRQISHYERHVRDLTLTSEGIRDLPTYIRDPAFRRVVTEIYDYRCAATGIRLVLPDGRALVEAAHIHPFAESADDDPRNGLALTPDMHWAMDRYLIAPGPDFKWHVSTTRLDHRIPDHQILTRLNHQPIILPAERRMYPKRESLQWRLEMLE